jgi:predicted transcriptional regulator of viral defense system
VSIAHGKVLDPRAVTATVRHLIETAGERIWRLTDFKELSFQAVAQALSRLARQGKLHKLGKGLYYRPRQTAFGPSLHNPAALRALPLRQKAVFPAGLSAAHLLGFTTQQPARIEVATDGTSLPRQIVGQETVIHTRRPPAWRSLSEGDAALLDFLRNRGKTSELTPEETLRKLLASLRKPGRFERLLHAAPSEPPRVRAMLGAIGQQLGRSEKQLARLRADLHPLSRFDFGALAALTHADSWQAKKR